MERLMGEFTNLSVRKAEEKRGGVACCGTISIQSFPLGEHPWLIRNMFHKGLHRVESHLAVPDGQNQGQTIRDSETSGRVKWLLHSYHSFFGFFKSFFHQRLETIPYKVHMRGGVENKRQEKWSEIRGKAVDTKYPESPLTMPPAKLAYERKERNIIYHENPAWHHCKNMSSTACVKDTWSWNFPSLLSRRNVLVSAALICYEGSN